MNSVLREELVKMDQHDQSVRAELAADGSLFNGYHPRMEAVHRANAERLRAVIQEFGWPTEALTGAEGAKAAWRIAQHSIAEPEFMRQCRKLLDEVSSRGEVPRWQFAFIEDRIRMYEGRPQRFGTQLCGGVGGLQVYPLENAARVEDWRKEAGLPPLAKTLARARENPPPTHPDQKSEGAKEREWRRKVGWLKD
jgi:hypothetical protein